MKRTKSTTREEYMEGERVQEETISVNLPTRARAHHPPPLPRLMLVDDVCISQGKNVSRTLRGKKSKLR